MLTPCVRGTAAFKRTPSGQPEGFASETALLIGRSHSPRTVLCSLAKVLLSRHRLQTTGGGADAGYKLTAWLCRTRRAQCGGA